MWGIIIVSALTDAIILSGTTLTSAMLATGSVKVPEYSVLILTIIGGVVAFARTIQQHARTMLQALKNTPEANKKVEP